MTMHYSSGEEVRPGDTVECADGVQGTVVFTLTPGETTQSNPLCRGYLVRKSDGTNVHYQPSDKSIRLLPHVMPKLSKTMSKTIKKKEFLQLMEILGSHSLYYPEPIAEHLLDCGITTITAPDNQGILLEGHMIPVWKPECGEPGISLLAILSVVFEIATGEKPHSDMTGMGFRFQDVMRQLTNYWGLDGEY